MECIFCKILKGEIPTKKVFENDKFIVILDAFPANIGHCLVIPKKHFENIFEIDDETIAQAIKIAKLIAKSLKQNLNIENINILQNNGSIAGQSVNHFHIHVIPRFENDNVTIKSQTVDIDENTLNEILTKLKKDF